MDQLWYSQHNSTNSTRSTLFSMGKSIDTLDYKSGASSISFASYVTADDVMFLYYKYPQYESHILAEQQLLLFVT